KRGTGTLIIDFDPAHVTDTASDYTGHTEISGGNLHFATADDLPNAPGGNLGQILSYGGAIGVDDGVLSNATFLGWINNSYNLNPPTPGGSPSATPYFMYTGPDSPATQGYAPIFAQYDSGGLMLGVGEYSQDLNFAAGGALWNAANMSLAAHEGGSSYSGK